MSDDTKNTINTSRDGLFALSRFMVSLIAIVLLAIADLYFKETVPTIVYCLIGGLNGVDAYKLYKEISR